MACEGLEDSPLNLDGFGLSDEDKEIVLEIVERYPKLFRAIGRL